MSDEMVEPVEVLSEFLLYQTEGGETRVQVNLFEGTVWLTQRLIVELYHFWYARDIQELQGYREWRNLLNVIENIRKFCKTQNLRFQTILLMSTKWSPLGLEV